MFKIDALQVAEQTKHLYRHQDEVDNYLGFYQGFPYEVHFTRLIRWLDFFNHSFFRHQCVHYHHTIKGLFELWYDGALLQEQTGYEFDLSIQFYESFFDFAKGSVITDVSAAKKLLVLSCIFSKYHGMMQKSVLHFFANHSGHINEEFIVDAIEHAFVKYETPGYLISNLEILKAEEVHVLMEALQGKNLRKSSIFPKPIAKSEFARLYALNIDNFRFHNQISLRGAIIVKLTKDPIDVDFLNVFLTASDTFQRYPGRIWIDIAFWKKAYNLIREGIHGAERCSVTDCVDFLEYMKYQQPEPFSLKGRTSNSLFRLVAEWHGYVHRLDFTEHRKEAWEKSKEKDLQFYCNNKLYQCKELHTGQMLYSEGQELSHCVITYTSAAKSGHCAIWSLREWNEQVNKFEPIITIEVSLKRILQALGYDNRAPTSEELSVIKDWAERMDYEIDLIKNQ